MRMNVWNMLSTRQKEQLFTQLKNREIKFK